MKALVLGPGLAAHWALGVLLLLGLAAEDWSGAGSLVSIAIALVTVILSALCHSPDTRAGGSVARFLATWVALLGHVSAVATAARALSAALGYIGDGRWLGAFLGARRSGPDVVSFVVAAVPALLCALGLEPSPVLRVLLNTTVAACLVFFVVVGSLHADVSMWTEQGVMASGVHGLIGGAALCSYGFMGLQSPHKGTKGSRVGLGVVLITSHCIVATLLAMLVQYRGLHGSSVPLLQVFEVRDVDWARLVMASCSILALALSVLEISAPLHALLVCLAGDEWRLLPRILASENNCTGTPLVAIITSGLTASLLAFICPLRLAVRLTCICPLVQNCLMASEAIYNQYRPPGDNITLQTSASAGKYKRLNKKKGSWSTEDKHHLHSATVNCLKSGLSLALGNSRRGAMADSRSASNGTIATCLISGSTPSLQAVSINSDGFDSSIVSNGSVVKVLNENQIEIGSYTYKKSPSTIHLNSLYSNGYVDSKNIINGVLSENNKHINGNSHLNLSTNTSIVSNKSYMKSIIAQDGVTQTFIDMSSPERTRFSNNLNMKKSPANSENKVFNLTNNSEEEHNVKIVDIQNNDDRLAYCKERFPMDLSQSEEEELSSSDAESDNSCSSSTDIDAIVAEYKEKLKVATTAPSATSVHEQVATAATCRRVLFCLFALPFFLATFGTGCVVSTPASIWCICVSIFGIAILFCLIARQPTASVTQTVPWIPWLPMICMVMCTALGSQIMDIVWPGVLVWISAGLTLYCWRKQLCHRGPSSSRRERIRLHAPPRHATISTLVPSHRHLRNDQARRLTCVDTILISR